MDHLWVKAIYDTKKGLSRWNKFEVNEQTRLCKCRTYRQIDRRLAPQHNTTNDPCGHIKSVHNIRLYSVNIKRNYSFRNATIPQHTWCTSARSRARSRAHRRPARPAGWSSCCGWVLCTPCTWSTPRATVSPCTQTSSYLQHGRDYVYMDCVIVISWPKPVIKQWSWKYWLRSCHILAYSYNIAACKWKLIRQLNFHDRNIIIIRNKILQGFCIYLLLPLHLIL